MGHRLSMLAGLLLVCSSAYAQNTPGFRIAVAAPAGEHCVSAERLTELVEARVGGRSLDTPELEVDVRIEAQPLGYRALVRVRDASGPSLGERELENEGECSELTEALTLVIASSVGLREIATPPPTAREPPPAVASQPDTSDNLPTTISPGPPARWTVSLQASGRALHGSLPALSAGPELGLFVGYGRFLGGVIALWLPPRVSAPSDRPVRTSGALGEVHLCSCVLGTAARGLAVCAGLQAGALRTVAQWLPDTPRRWSALVQLMPGVRGQLRLLGRLGVTVGLGASIPVLFPRFNYVSSAGSEVPHHTVELGIWGELGFSVGFDS